ncbi:hypothetical protein [Prevotella ihumii]|nr:hypothetical protein [Prevotella ihumii]
MKEGIALTALLSPIGKLHFIGWCYKLALLDFELILEVKMQEREGV